MSMRNPLERARGHGSAKSGVHHWYAQRASALLLIVLTGWLVYALSRLAGADHATAVSFLAQPANAAVLLLLIVTLLYHAMLGLQVVIEDYVHAPRLSWFSLLLSRALHLAVGLLLVYTVYDIGFSA